MVSVIQNAKSFAISQLSNNRAAQTQVQGSTPEVKFYSSQNTEYSALFAIITLGTAPDAIRIINVFGKFDNALLGGSVNIPSNLVGSTHVTTNPLLRQFIAYRGDAAGEAYFSHADTSPPPCDQFNYSIMIMGDGSGSFGIKGADWKLGDADKYTISVESLTPSADITQPTTWCKDLLPLVTAEPPKRGLAGSIALQVFWIVLILLCIWIYWLSQQR